MCVALLFAARDDFVVLLARGTVPPILAVLALAVCDTVDADVDGSVLWLRVRIARICAPGATVATCACGVLPRVLTMAKSESVQ